MSADRDYLSLPLSEFLADIAARCSMPGGGSVAAAVGAMAAALGAMAIEYTVGKKEFAAHECRLREALEELTRVRGRLSAMIKDDMDAYVELTTARKSGGDVAAATARAAGVPMDIVTHACLITGLLNEVHGCTNLALLSDLKAAAILAEASARAAAGLVRENLAGMSSEQARADHDRLNRMLHAAGAQIAWAK